MRLNSADVPVVSLELGSNLNSTTIREGADVYFECNIKSNPWVYKVNWNHNVSIYSHFVHFLDVITIIDFGNFCFVPGKATV